MYLNIHLIHNFPASNLNRDDTGAPKDTDFGGFRRARISSQCQKRAIRWHEAFRDEVKKAGGNLGVRTIRFIDELVRRFVTEGKNEEDAKTVAEAVITALGLKKAKKSDKTEYLLYLGEGEMDELAATALEYWEEGVQGKFEKEAQKRLNDIVKERKKKGGYAADIALFGRMVADDKKMNVDAACQVAHAISTHKSAVETDYFTAVDDLLPDDETGSDMIGVVEYNGACYYRYANIDLEKLKENLGVTNADLLEATVAAFLKAMALALPTGMQNSFAAQTYPSYIEVVVMDKPLSYANAFSKPARGSEKQSIEESSTKALQEYGEKIERFLGAEPLWRESIDVFEKGGSLPELVEKVRTHLKES